MRCIVPTCKHDSRRTSKSQGVTFHIFPTEPSLRMAWLKALDKEGWNPRERSAVCSNHFLTDDLYVTRSGLRKVRAGAVPIVMQNAPKCDFLITPSDVKVCRICFATDCNLYPMTVYKNLDQAYEILTGISIENEENLPSYLCTECAHRLINSVHFRTRSLRAHLILMEIVKKHEYITLETIKSINRKQSLLSSNLDIMRIQPDHYDLVIEHKEPETDLIDTDMKDLPEIHEVNMKDLPDIHEVNIDGIKAEGNMVNEVLRDDVGDDVLNDGETNDDMVFGDAFVGKDYSSDDSQPLGQKAKRKRRARKVPIRDLGQPKVDRRRKPFLNDDLNETLFTISDLTVEEQIAAIEKRQESSNYRNSMFKCTVCYKGFLDQDAFNSHMTRHTNQCGEHECEICKTHFKHPHALRKHITAHHTQRFSCNQCPYVTTHRQTARLHERWHKGTKYRCPHCQDEFLKFTTYMGHIRIKHPSDFVCELCGYSFVSEKGIELHKKLKHRLENTQVPDDGPLCELCNVRFVSEEAYRRHLSVSAKHNAGEKQTKEPKPVKLRKSRGRSARSASADSGKLLPALLRTGPIPCEQVGGGRGDSGKLLPALLRTGPIPCEQVGGGRGDSGKLLPALLRTGPIPCEQVGGGRGDSGKLLPALLRTGPIPCEQVGGGRGDSGKLLPALLRTGPIPCEQVGGGRGDSGKLLPALLRTGPIPCEQVGGGRGDSGKLLPALLRTGPIPCEQVGGGRGDSGKLLPALLRTGPIPCEQCGLQLEDSRAYHGHFRRMHPDKNRTNYPSMKSPCMCEVCGRMFQSFALLKDHRWVHTGERPFACDACGKCFRMRQRLVAHRRVHDQAKSTYTCALCGKHFSTHSNRQRHMFIHTGLKPFKCEMCGKSFKHASEKRAHVTYVHLKKPWPKRTRGKRRTDRPGQLQGQGSMSAGASEMDIVQPIWPPCDPKMADMNITGDKSVYYNLKI
ncbi:uncharacterized protein [Epargyreus clarus]|uniref:uncharacterized protein n=1 Tax=Epargyreus clarus TaxID=520877 RepID=UPI003C2B7C0B